VAFAEIDLNPSLEQKVDALRFARKLPDVDKDVKEDSDLREVVYEGLTEDVKNAPPWSSAKEWIGDRAAIAMVPATGGEDPFEAVAVLAVKDEGKARTDLAKLSEKGDGYAVRDGWAVLTESQPLADQIAAVTEDKSLAGSDTFKQDVDRLGDTGIISAWFDGRELADAAKAYAQKEADSTEGLSSALDSLDQFKDQLGHGAATIRFSGPQLELAMVTVGAKPSTATAGTDLDKLPADSLVAISTQGLDQQLTDAWPSLAKQGGDQLAEGTGLTLPKDLAALLGQRTQIVLSKGETKIPDFGIRVSSKDAGLPKILDTVMSLSEEALPLQRKDLPGGYVLSSSPEQAAALAEDDGGLGATKGFKDVLPELGSAQSAAFVNLAGLADFGDLDAEEAKGLKALGVAGLTASVDGDGVGHFTLRVGTR
jgi:hypothetical protein